MLCALYPDGEPLGARSAGSSPAIHRRVTPIGIAMTRA